MKWIKVNGTEVYTNYGENGMFAIHSGNPGKTQRLEIKRNDETNREFLERLVDKGYKRIRFAHVSTYVPGYHETIALCK